MRKVPYVSKYGNKKTVVGVITFDSKREAERYKELFLLLQNQKIRNLKLQPQFTLIEGYKDPETGEAVRPLKYVADFVYEEQTEIKCENGDIIREWRQVVEDTKGHRTQEYEIKRKMMLERGIRIRET